MTAHFRESVHNEEARVKALRDLNLVDTSPCAMIGSADAGGHIGGMIASGAARQWYNPAESLRGKALADKVSVSAVGC